MIVAYLVAQYPKTSHTFIRREIAALERLGFTVRRYSTRPVEEPLVDPDDVAERGRTRVLFGSGPVALVARALPLAFRRPGRWIRALRQAVRASRGSDRGLVPHVAYFLQACVLVRWMEAEGVEHLHAHFGTNATAIALIARALGGPPYSFTVHGTADFGVGPLLGFEGKVRESKFAVAISHYARAQLLLLARVEDRGKIHVVRCGLDSTHLEQPQAALPREPRLACVARFDPEKGHLVLLEAAALLARDGVPFDIELIGDGPLRPEIERAVTRLGLGRRVVLSGWLGSVQVRDRLLACRALVVPSFAEGLPVVIMEAFALGRPVVSTCVGGIPELVEDGENGWLVAPSSVEELASALRAVLSARDEDLARMGARGRERVLALHQADVEAGKLAALFSAAPGSPQVASNGLR